jgi:hypothetical protein
MNPITDYLRNAVRIRLSKLSSPIEVTFAELCLCDSGVLIE